MKKCILLFLSFQLFLCFSLYAQVAKIIDLKGTVKIKKDLNTRWEKAKVNTYLNKQDQIKTGNWAECTITFDEELKNILTIKENSNVTLEGLKPGKVYLPRGRVFSLIDDLAKIEGFQVRTPTAIIGVRGTGDSVESGIHGTKVKCFQGKVNVGGQDDQGNGTGNQDLTQGLGIGVDLAGLLSKFFDLTGGDWDDWNDFLKYVQRLKSKPEANDSGRPLGDSGHDIGDSFGDLRDEQRDDFKDLDFEEFRRSREDSGDSQPRSPPNGDGYGE